MTAEELIAFEREVADLFNAGKIRAPVHLSGGNEEQLIEIFKGVGPEDWVTSTWRSHYHCLLKGVPRATLLADIVAGKSIALCYPEYKILSSAIVGGSLSIALGVALGIKRRGGKERVWAFIGDMATRGGAFHECAQYAEAFSLPVRWIIEDNGISVCTSTQAAWNNTELTMREYGHNIIIYRYKLPWPHAGAGIRVQF